MNYITLLDLILQEYIAIMEYLISKLPIKDERIVLDNNIFYTLLDKNLYIKRIDKLKIYRQLHFIECNSNSFTSVVYNKELRKSQRKIVVNIDTYRLVKGLIDKRIQGEYK